MKLNSVASIGGAVFLLKPGSVFLLGPKGRQIQMPKVKPKPSDDLPAVSDDLFYEIDMLHATGKELELRKGAESVIGNALVESFAIHVRTLIEFFETRDNNHNEQYVKAVDFIDDPRIDPPEHLKKLLDRINIEIVHLGFRRRFLDDLTRQWPIGDITKEIDKLIAAFVARVPDARLGELMKKYKHETNFGALPGLTASSQPITPPSLLHTASVEDTQAVVLTTRSVAMTQQRDIARPFSRKKT